MPAASPLAYLTLAFSGTHTMWIWYIVHTAYGFASMWLLARREFKLTRAAAFAAASLWALGVGHVTQYAGGHATLCNFYLFPLLLLLWRRAEESLDAAVGLGLVFAYMFYEGSAYPIVHSSLLLACETVIRLATGGRGAISARRMGRLVRGFAIVSAVAFTVAAARLLPVLGQVKLHSRGLEPETDAITGETLFAMFFHRQHAWTVPGQTYVWPEFASYFGYVTIVLVLVGMLAAGYEHVWFLALGTIAFTLMMGHWSPWAPWSLLKGHVFPFSSMRVPSRFRLFVAGFFAIFVGLAVDKLPERLRSFGLGPSVTTLARTLLVCFAVFAAGDVFAVSHETVGMKYSAPAETTSPRSPRLFLEGPGIAPFLDQPRQNRGRLGCADSWPFNAGAPVWVGDVPQARSSDPNAVVELVNRTPNKFFIDVDVKAPARIEVNTPYEPGWRTSIGTTFDKNRVLGLDLPPGRHRVKVFYWPPGLTLGIVFTVLGLAGAIAFLFRKSIAEEIRERRESREKR
jgi:hypothetical protein